MARKTHDSAVIAQTDMRELAATIGRIESNSEAMVKIIQTIDEIAFQINILALNAAVEAARAGKAGKGF
ncbi:MAG: methyl-accepting chemotaxis protein, partial [Desulfobulbaceae bacterium]|nr:methyl-accepting chemotaxis protein [Desulfobulbaceae bacterium]